MDKKERDMLLRRTLYEANDFLFAAGVIQEYQWKDNQKGIEEVLE